MDWDSPQVPDGLHGEAELMTEQTGQQGMPQSDPPDWYKNPPPWWNSAPQQRTQPPPWQGQGQGQQGPSNYDILTAINGAPERIVNAIREATKQVAPPSQQAAPAPQQQQQQQPPQQHDNPPRERNFAEKWFDLAP